MKKDLNPNVSNPGSAIGEALGVVMEEALNEMLKPVADAAGYIHISVGPKNKKNENTKLKLMDAYNNPYFIDAVIANNALQPLVLIESKYLRYTKHNRDKGSWICFAHTMLRERYSSVRSSITVLAGSWSGPSKAMMRSQKIALFEIPFNTICEILNPYGVNFRWGEKEREKADQAWKNFIMPSEQQRSEIGAKLIDVVEDDLQEMILNVLDDSIPRSVQEVEVQVSTNLGEVKLFTFFSIEEALTFLQDFNAEKVLSSEEAPVLYDNQLSVSRDRNEEA